MDKKTVYIVTSGSYSDYRICAVFDNQEAAEAYIETERKFGRASEINDIEEWDLNSTTPPHRVWYTVYVDIDGNVTQQTSWVEWYPNTEAEERVGESYLAGTRETKFYATSYRGYDVATKAARDKLAQWKAEQAGV